MKIIIIFCVFLFTQSCAGPNPNPGERTADVLWSQEKFDRALEIIRPKAENNFPWAQVRIGVAYQLGRGVKQDFSRALEWYKKAAIQKSSGEWANGKLIGSFGRSGYFNQNSDAMVAQYQISTIYLHSDKLHEDIIKAYLWINYVLSESKGMHVFYCCEFSGGRWITQGLMRDTLSEINKKITKKQKDAVDNVLKTWSPLQDL